MVTEAKNLLIPAPVGYLPPEYYEGRYSTWSDVYSCNMNSYCIKLTIATIAPIIGTHAIVLSFGEVVIFRQSK